jgi:hypothetical protein
MSARNYIAVQIQLESMKQQSLPYLISGRMRFNQKMSAVDRLSTRSTEDFMDSARCCMITSDGRSRTELPRRALRNVYRQGSVRTFSLVKEITSKFLERTLEVLWWGVSTNPPNVNVLMIS